MLEAYIYIDVVVTSHVGNVFWCYHLIQVSWFKSKSVWDTQSPVRSSARFYPALDLLNCVSIQLKHLGKRAEKTPFAWLVHKKRNFSLSLLYLSGLKNWSNNQSRHFQSFSKFSEVYIFLFFVGKSCTPNKEKVFVIEKYLRWFCHARLNDTYLINIFNFYFYRKWP